MKSVLRTKLGKAEEKYPYLGVSVTNRQIILFTEFNQGVVIHSGHSNNYIGQFSKTWAMDCFEPYTGEVTLSND